MDISELDGHATDRKHSDFKAPPPPQPRRSLRDDERKGCFDRIEGLAKQLKIAIREEMRRRKEHWDMEGDREEEEKWEGRKQEVYKALEELADEIQRAVRDRKKEAVLELWSREADERTQRRAAADGVPVWAPPRQDAD